MASTGFFQSISMVWPIIVTPTIIKIAAVISDVTIDISGDRKSAKKNPRAVIKFARPVLAPDSIPVIVSPNDEAGDVPSPVETKTHNESAIKTFFKAFLSFRFKVSSVALILPAALKINRNRIAKRLINISNDLSSERVLKPSIKPVKLGFAGIEKIPLKTIPVSKLHNVKIIPNNKVPSNVMIIEPFTFKAVKTIINKSPNKAIQTLGFARFPKEIRVESFFTINPAFIKPTRAMKSPIPVPIAFFKKVGKDFIINSLNPVIVRTRYKMALIKEIDKASLKLNP